MSKNWNGRGVAVHFSSRKAILKGQRFAGQGVPGDRAAHMAVTYRAWAGDGRGCGVKAAATAPWQRPHS